MFNEFLQHEKHRLNLPGLAVAITEGTREVFSSGIGFCDVAEKEPVTPDSLFGVASVTKLLTAVEIMRLAEQGLLGMEDPVVQHLPQLQVAQKTPIQLNHFLSHSAGLPGLDCRFKAKDIAHAHKEFKRETAHGLAESEKGAARSDQIATAAELVDYINSLNVQLIAPPGQRLNYSNEGYCLLGGIIEKLCAQSYSGAISNDILRPLNLSRSVIGGSELAKMGNVAYPLLRDESGFTPGHIWEAPLFYPAGGLVASARDLAKLIRMVFKSNDLLSAHSKGMLASPVMSVSSRPYGRVGYSYGLEYRQIDASNTVLWHTGQRPGISSFIAWHREQEIAVSVLSHIADAPVAGIGYALLGKLLASDDFAWPPIAPSAGVPSNIKCDGRYVSVEGFDFQVESSATGSKLYSNYLVGSKREEQANQFNFADETSGTVGAHTFRFLQSGASANDVGALAIDLRVLQRSVSDL